MVNQVVVYGSLKRGFYNNRCFPEGSKYIKDISLSGYKMLNLGSYPGVIEGDSVVHGELWDTPDMSSLDMLESNGSFYTRYIKTYTDGVGNQGKAWVYLLPQGYADRYEEIDDGTWRS